MNDSFFMQLAINEAWKYQLLTYPNPAVGAVVVQNGALLSIEAHQKAGTSHAEVLALLGAYEKITQQSIDFDRFDATLAHQFLRSLPKGFFKDCEIYVTLEPCSHIGKTPSCASLLSILNLKRVIIATKDPIKGHDNGSDILANVTIGVKEDKALKLLEPFLIWQERAFVLFKLAQSTNARIGGGYLSSQESLTHTHKLRAVSSKMLIGGNTVRVDRPTLDCRFIDAKAPDIYIYTHSDDLDRDIALFGVESRDVKLGDDLSFLQKPSFVLVEGGEGMLQAMAQKIDWMLFYQTPKLSCNNLTYNIDMDLEFLHIDKNDTDLMIWSKNLGN